MRIFEFDTQDNQAYLYATEDVRRRCKPEPPKTLGAHWSPPALEIVTSDEYRSYLPKSDFPTFTIATMVLSARAVDRLRPILIRCGEILPIRLSNDPDTLCLFNVTLVLDAVDMKRSEFMRLPSGGIMKYERLVFDPKAIPDEALFFKTTQLGPVTEIFVTERAVAAVDEAHLTGYEFRLIWSNE
jgi:hypothetical protein